MTDPTNQDPKTNPDPKLDDKTKTPPATPPVFEDWIKSQSEDVRKSYDAHITGLRNTVQATRAERDGFAKELRDAAEKLEKGSEAQKSLTEMAGKLEAAEKRVTFFEEAIKPEIGCSNPKAAFLLAIADNLFDRKGNPDWTAIKLAAPELFQKKVPVGNAGDGTHTDKPASQSMNEFIRASAGRLPKE
jgi:hypothetical protein